MERWTQWDGTGSRTRPYIDPGVHAVFYYRQYIAGGGYATSETNQLVLNLKKDVGAPSNQLHYKNQAINKFSEELIPLFKQEVEAPSCMTWIPPSKAKTDSGYDNRLEQVVKKVCCATPLVPVETFVNRATRDALHSGHSRNPILIACNLRWCDCSLSNYNAIFVVDDVLTTGASFRAVHDKIQENYPHIRIIGIFWAITIDEDPAQVFAQSLDDICDS